MRKATETVNDAALAENLNRLGVRVLLKPFHIEDLLKANAGVLATQMLTDHARDDGGEFLIGGVLDTGRA